MDFLKLLEEYENYKRGFGIEPKSSGHSACVDFAIWLNNNSSQQSVHLTVLPVREIETVCPHCSLVFDVPVPEPHSK